MDSSVLLLLLIPLCFVSGFCRGSLESRSFPLLQSRAKTTVAGIKMFHFRSAILSPYIPRGKSECMCGPHSTVFCLCSRLPSYSWRSVRSAAQENLEEPPCPDSRLTQTHPLHPSVRPSASASVLSSRRLLRVFIGKGRRTRSVGSSLRKASEQLCSLSCVGEVREGGREEMR